MNIRKLIEAGFDDSEIQKYVWKRAEEARIAGFSDDEIRKNFGVPENTDINRPGKGGTVLTQEQEAKFQTWYKGWADKLKINPNPDDPQHFYNYRAAFQTGTIPNEMGHWPSQFKLEGHPNRYVGGMDTITGLPKDPSQTTAALPDLTYDFEQSTIDYLNKNISGENYDYPEAQQQIAAVLTEFTRPLKATGAIAAQTANESIYSMMMQFDQLGKYLAETIRTKEWMPDNQILSPESEGFWKKEAKLIEDNPQYWKEQADKYGPNFLDNFFGRLMGGTVPGIVNFMLDLGLAWPKGAMEAKEAGKGPVGQLANAFVSGAQRLVLGKLFHAYALLKSSYRIPLTGITMATQGKTWEERTELLGAGLTYGALPTGGNEGLRDIYKGLETYRKGWSDPATKIPQYAFPDIYDRDGGAFAHERANGELVLGTINGRILRPDTYDYYDLRNRAIKKQEDKFEVFRASQEPYEPSRVGEAGVYVTETEQGAKEFAQAGRIVEKLLLSKDAKILEYENIPEDIRSIKTWDKYSLAVAKYARENGYDAVYSTPSHPSITGGKPIHTEITVVNPTKLQKSISLDASMREMAQKEGYFSGIQKADGKIDFFKEPSGTVINDDFLYSLTNEHQIHGRATWDMRGEKPLDGEEGFTVDLYADTRAEIKGDKISREQLKQYIKDNYTILAQDGVILETRYDKDRNISIIDAAFKFGNEFEAKKAAVECGADAVRNLKDDTMIPIRPLEHRGEAAQDGTEDDAILGFAPEKGYERKEQEPGPGETYEGPPISRQQITEFLRRKLKQTIRMGRIHQKGTLGYFEPWSELIRIKKVDDISVIFHEIGHGLQKFLFPNSFTGKNKGRVRLPQAWEPYRYELEANASPAKAGQDPATEGVAEFLRFYGTNEGEAHHRFPTFYKAFEDTLDALAPETKAILQDARELYNKYHLEGRKLRALGLLSISEHEPIRPKWQNAYRNWVDEFYPLDKIVKEMMNGEKLKVSQDPATLLRLNRGWPGLATHFLERGPFNYFTYKNEGEPFNKILQDAPDLNDFRIYLFSKRTLEKAEQGIETGLSVEDAKGNINELRQIYEPLRKRIWEYQDHLLQFFTDSGMLTPELVGKFRRMNQDFAPLYPWRVEEGKQLGAKGGLGQGQEAHQPIRKMEGGWDRRIDPLESIVKNTLILINLAERNAAGQALWKFFESKEGHGKYMNPVKAPVMSIRIGKEELEGHLKKLGFEVPEEGIEIFRPTGDSPPGQIKIFFNGKPKYFEVHPEIEKIWKSLDRESAGMVLKLLSYPASWLRAGAILTPEFIVRNPVRDQQSAFMLSKYGFIPGYDFAKGVFHMLGKDDVYWDWMKGGGAQATMVSLDRRYLQEKLGKLLQEHPWKYTLRNPIQILRAISELGEVGTRLGEFAKGQKKELKRGLTVKEAIQQAAFSSREVTLDFQRIGAKARALNMTIAFWNANVQGTDRMVREAIANPMMFGLKVAPMTAISILLAVANHDDYRYKYIVQQWQKDLFWIVPSKHITEEAWNAMTSAEQVAFNDKYPIYRIPKPFEMGIIFGSIPERMTEWCLNKTPGMTAKLLSTMWRGMSPGIFPTASLAPLENMANYSFFFDRKIEPEGSEDLPPYLRYRTYTSETAKKIGEMISHIPLVGETGASSPAKIENLVRGWLGGLGMNALYGMERLTEAAGISPRRFSRPPDTLADLPLVKAFAVRSPSTSAEVIQDFYTTYKKMKQYENAAKFYMNRLGDAEKAVGISMEHQIGTLNGYYEAMKQQNMLIRMVNESDWTPNDKKQVIDETLFQMIDIAKMGLELFRALEPDYKNAK